MRKPKEKQKEKEIMKRNTKVKQKDDNNASAPHMSATVTTTSISNSTTQDCVTVERCCENVDCNASKLLAMVPTRKTPQFVLQPSIMEKPTLINGFTTVFQVEGTPVRLRDIKNVTAPKVATTTSATTTSNIIDAPSSATATVTTTTAGVSSSPSSSSSTSSPLTSTLSSLPSHIYRIVPNTHAHVVNYVLVDGDDELLHKIQASDPATMRKLLDSQKVSGDQMLKKLMVGINVGANRSPGDDNATATRNLNANGEGDGDGDGGATADGDGSTLDEVILPARKHPNLQITAISSVKASPSNVAEESLTTTPLPGNLENITTITTNVTTTTITTTTPSSSPNMTTTRSSTFTTDHPTSVGSSKAKAVVEENPAFDKMQAELQELRRTVALLAEAQAKTSHATQRRKLLATKKNPEDSKAVTIASRPKRSRKMMEY